jgi:DNA polymerase V
MLMGEVLREVGVRATCGIGTNLYLAKIALDITAKHAVDFIGVLDESSFRKLLWDHTPLTDFWRIGKGTAKTLERYGINTMRQIAEMDEDFLYRLLGIDAELLIDHAWGREPVKISDIKAYKSKTNSLSSGQVLMRDYNFEEGRLIVREMLDLLCLDLVEKGLITDSVSIQVGYSNALKAEPARGTAKLNKATSADSLILPAVTKVYERIVDREKPVRRINISCNHITESSEDVRVQMSLFDNDKEDELAKRNHSVQKAVIDIKKKYGKNAVLKGMNYSESATTRERNRQIGGHKSGE